MKYSYVRAALLAAVSTLCAPVTATATLLEYEIDPDSRTSATAAACTAFDLLFAAVDCTYDDSKAAALGGGTWVGPRTRDGFYPLGQAQTFANTGVPAGATGIALSGTIEIDTQGTADCADDTISGTIDMAPFTRNFAANAVRQVENFAGGISQALVETQFSTGTANGAGGCDYTLGANGVPGLLTGNVGDFPGTAEDPTWTAPGEFEISRFQGTSNPNPGARSVATIGAGYQCLNNANPCASGAVADVSGGFIFAWNPIAASATPTQKASWGNIVGNVSTDGDGNLEAFLYLVHDDIEISTFAGQRISYHAYTATIAGWQAGSGTRPNANPDVATTSLNVPLIIDVLANDSFPEGPVRLAITLAPDNGGLAEIVDADGNPVPDGAGDAADLRIRYVPNAPAGTPAYEERFTYRLFVDDNGTERGSSALVTVNVEEAGARDDQAVTGRDQGVSIAVLANDIGLQDPVAVSIVLPPTLGTATVVGSPGAAAAIRIDYQPAAGQLGLDTFTYQVSDPFNVFTAEVSVQIRSAEPDVALAFSNKAVLIPVLQNDPGFGAGAVVTILVPPSGGVAEVVESPTSPGGVAIRYQSDEDFTGTDTLVYQVADDNGLSTAEVTITVSPLVGLDDFTVVLDAGSRTSATVSSCTGFDLLFAGVDCTYNDSKPAALGGGTWVGPRTRDGFFPLGQAQIFANTGIPVNPEGVPLSGSLTILTQSSPDCADHAISGTVVMAPFTRNFAGNAVRQVENFAGGITQEIAETAFVSGIPNALGGCDYSLGANGVPALLDGTNGLFPGNAENPAWTAPGQFEISRFQGSSTPNPGARAVATVGAGYQCLNNGNPCASGAVADVSGGFSFAWNPIAASATPSQKASWNNIVGRLVTNANGDLVDAQLYLVHDDIEISTFAGQRISYWAYTAELSGVCVEGCPSLPVPVAVPDEAVTGEGQPVAIAVLANDLELAEVVSVTVSTPPANGQAEVVGSPGAPGGVLVNYTPEPGFTGVDEFFYTVQVLGRSGTARVTVTVRGRGSYDDFAETPVNTPVLIDVMANDVGFSDPVLLGLFSVPLNGSVVVIGSPGPVSGTGILYTPAAGFVGQDQFSYAVDDGVNIGIASVTVLVGAGRDDVAASTGDAIEIDILANDVGLPSAVAVEFVTPPANGSAVLVGSPGAPEGIRVLYTPDPGFGGEDTFTYRVIDGGTIGLATVSIQVLLANDDEVAVGHAAPVEVAVLANDSGLGTLVLLELVNAPANGGAEVLGSPGSPADIRVRYTPDAGFGGRDSLRYRVIAGAVAAEADVRFTVAAAPQADVAQVPVEAVTPLDVLANDGLLVGAVDVEVVTPPSHGTAVVTGSPGDAGDIRIEYTPAAGFAGDDEFSYRIAGGLDPASAGVTVLVRSAVDDQVETTVDTPVLIDVLANDRGFSGTVVLEVVSGPANGVAEVVAPTSGTYVLSSYTFCVPFGCALFDAASATAVVRGELVSLDIDFEYLSNPSAVVSYSGQLEAVLGAFIDVTKREETCLQAGEILDGAMVSATLSCGRGKPWINRNGLEGDWISGLNQAGEPDARYFQDLVLSEDGETLTFVSSRQFIDDPDSFFFGQPCPFGCGVLTMILTRAPMDEPGADGPEIRYTPAPGFRGTDSFVYRVSDGRSVAEATVSVVVPVGVDDEADAVAGVPKEIDVLANDGLLQDPVVVEVTSLPANGTAMVSGSPGPAGAVRIIYTAAPGFSGTDSLSYSVTDGISSGSATVTLNVIVDDDDDGIPDDVDNCLGIANPDQRDTDGDGFGNRCDADFNNDGVVNFADLAIFRSRFGTNDPDADLNGDGVVNFADLAIFNQLFGRPPGPSAVVP